MSLLPSIGHALVLVWLTAGASSTFAVDPPTFPPGKDFSAPKPLRRPGYALFRVVIVREALTSYKSFEGDEVHAAPALKFGDSAYVVHVHEGAAGKPSRYLLARFGGDLGFGGKDARFESWIGWINPNYLVSETRPLQVKQTHDAVSKAVLKGHPYFDRIKRSFPDVAREEFWNVPLKAVMLPDRGKASFPRPVPPEDYDKMVKTDQAIALQPFAFFYVYAIAVEPRNVYLLLGPRSTISLDEGNLGDKLRQQLLGWVELESVLLWTTREAFEFHLERPVLESRREANRPIEFFASSKDLKDWATWELDGRKGDCPVRPIYSEDLLPAKAPPWMQKTWDARWMRFPILASYPLQKPDVPGISGKWLGYQLCVPGNPTLSVRASDIEVMKKKLNDAVKLLRVFDLVIVLDTTGNMAPVFPALKDGVVKLVEELKRKAGSEKDELELIQLRVAVVQYKDFPGKQDSAWLTKESDDYFDVMTEVGLNKFKEYVSEIQDGGGGDELEEPFEGIDVAASKFLSIGNSKHTAGAARMMLVIGDSGNHEKDPANDKIGTRLALADVLMKLDPVGEDVIGKQKKAVARIQLHSIMTLLFPGDQKKQRDGLKKWDTQIHELARKTGGTTHEVDFINPARALQANNRMADALMAALESRRVLLRKELEAIRLGFGATPDGKPTDSATTSLILAEDRLTELLGKEELSRIRKSLSQAFFTEVHTVEQIPGEPENLARLRLCVLLSETEFLNIMVVSQQLAVGLDREYSKGGLTGESGEKIALKIKEMMIRTMLVAFGEDVDPARVEVLRRKPFGEIQKEINQLPVLFGILKTQPTTEAELKKMIDTLKLIAFRLRASNDNQRGARMFNPGVATGEPHIWIYKHELP